MTKFELISDALSGSKAGDLRENCIYWLDGDKYVTINVSANGRYATRIRKLAEEHHDEVKIFSDEKGGYLVAVLPLKAVKLNMVTREITDDERDKLRERAAKAREAKRK